MTGSKLGRDVVYDYLRDLDVHYLFGVPGTNEIPIIDGTSLADNGVTYIPCLHENIAIGAAMGYAHATGKPGVVELHVTPGAGHGIGNLFNAYKSHIPVVVLCAQQQSELLLQEPLLASDLAQVARQYTKWTHEVRFPDELPMVLQRAFKEALAPPRRPVFLSIPWDFTIDEVQEGPAHVTRIAPHFVADRGAVAKAAERLAAASNPVIVAGDGVGAAGAWAELERLASLLGAPVYSETLSTYLNFPNHSHRWQGELPGTQAAMQAAFRDHDVAFLCGYNAQAQVLVFKYDLGPMIPHHVAQIYLHDDPWEIGKNGYGEVAMLGDIKATLPVLCDEIAAHPRLDQASSSGREDELHRLDEVRQGQLVQRAKELSERSADSLVTGEQLATAIAKLQPEMAAPLLLVNEAISDLIWFESKPAYDEPNCYFSSQGGSLGFSMPASIGLKVGAGASRTVINVVGDGSALFYPHTWWTSHHFDVPVLYVITNNREYKTLIVGLEQVEQIYGWNPTGPPWYLYLDKEPVSYVDLAKPFGVDGLLVSNLGELDAGLRRGLSVVEKGRPFVLEVLTDRSLPPVGPQPRLDVLLAAKPGAVDDAEARFSHLGPP